MKFEKLAPGPVVVVGYGWSALAAVGFLVKENRPVVWIAGTASRMHPVLPTFHAGAGLETWKELARVYDIETGEEKIGNFIREFKNKSFRSSEPQALVEKLWTPEVQFAREGEVRLEIPLIEIEARIRANLIDGDYPNLKRIEGTPLASIQIEEHKLISVKLGSGETIACSNLIFADRWNALSSIEGMPKGLSFTRKRGAAGILQAALTHDAPPDGSPIEAYFAPLTRDAGEDFDRNVWGYFSSDGKQSYWSTCVTSDEGEDNHLIAKKLRKMKASVDKMFAGTEFISNLKSEKVTFHESILFSEGLAPSEVLTLGKTQCVFFVTDSYGPSSALEQLSFLGHSEGPYAETKNVDAFHSATL